jgi:class 3 adenylate cyclase
MSDQPSRTRRNLPDLSKLYNSDDEAKTTLLVNLTRQRTAAPSASDEQTQNISAKPDDSSLRLSLELQKYLPPDLWRKLSNEIPRRGIFNNALERMQSLLYTISTYLPAGLVEEKINHPVPGLVNGKLLKGCLLFSDVSGFTALSERLAVLGPKGAEHLTGVINQYFSTMIDILSQSNGILLKFAGDATLIYFPEQEGGIHAQWAARAGLRMMRAMRGFANLPTPLGSVTITMKVGLSAGSFLGASVGSKKRMEYVLVGPTVSQTLQAEGCTTPGQIVTNQTAASLLTSTYEMIEVKPGFFLLNPGTDNELDEYEIRQPEKRRARGSTVQWSANPEEIVTEIKDKLNQIQALIPYLASELVERIISHADQRHVQSEYRPTTVMFCNFTGPDTLLETLGDSGISLVTGVLSAYFTDMNEIISRFGGIVSRIDPYSQGSKLLALFGAPIAHEDDAQRAISAALEMNSALLALNRRWTRKLARHLPPGSSNNFINHRIGITLGDTFAGQAGSSTRREYTVMGDEVNLAARLMSTARMGQILISELVLKDTGAYYVTRKLPPVRVKGKQNPIPIWQVDGPREDTLLNRIHNRTTLIGRSLELEHGWQIFQRTRAGTGCVLTLAGQAGIGKSHLADTLLKQALEDDWQAHAFQCRSYLMKEPYSCWKGLLRSFAGITSIDHSLIQKDKLERLATQVSLSAVQSAALTDMLGLRQTQVSTESEEEKSKSNKEDLASLVRQKKVSRRSRNMDYLDELVGGNGTATDGKAQITEQERNQRRQALAKILSALSAQKPLAIYFEDAQWMDAASIDLLKELNKELAACSLIFLLARRSQDVATEEVGEIIQLNPFTKAETRSMVAEILTAGLVDIIHEQSNGSPLFVEEISRWVKQTHNIDGKRLKDVLQSSDILQRLVLSRLESLPEGQREVARLASIVGVEFRQSEVEALLQNTIDERILHEYLNDLKEARLITLSEAVVDSRYTFIQPIFRDVLYTSLPFERRRELHALMAEHLLQLPSRRRQLRDKIAMFLEDKPDTHPLHETEKLAYHYEMSEQWLAAAKQLTQAMETFEPAGQIEIEALYNRALTLLEHYPAEKIDNAIRLQKTLAYIGLGNAALQRVDLAASAAAFESAIATAPAEDIPSDLTANVTARLALLLPSQGKIELAEKQLTKIITQRSRPDDWKLLGISAWLTWRAGHDPSSQIASCRASLPETDAEDCLRMRALMDDLSGDWAQAAETYQTLGEANAAALAWVQLGNQFLQHGNPAKAAKQYDLAAGIWQDVDFCGMALIHYRRAELAWQANHNAKALAFLGEALSLLDKSAQALQAEPRASIQKALTRVNKKQSGSWAYWHWQPFDDLSRINFCIPIFQETARITS